MTETTATPLTWTGERCVPWAPDYQVIYEHYHRYLWAATLLAPGSKVLDLASGEGYGSQLLASLGHTVTGVEFDPAAVAHAKKTYPDVSFEAGDMRKLGDHLADFDAVICFEALEHIVEHDELIAGVRKVLKPGGLFVVSTPDKDVYGGHSHGEAHDDEHDHGANPFHLRELNLPEFQEFLGQAFTHVDVFEQRFAVGSVISGLTTNTGSAQRGLVQGDAGWQQAATPPATYLLGIASNDPLPPRTGSDVLLDGELTIVRILEGQVQRLELALAQATRYQSNVIYRGLRRGYQLVRK